MDCHGSSLFPRLGVILRQPQHPPQRSGFKTRAFMAIDPACRIAVVNSCRYRAESLAFAIAQQSGYEALGATQSDLALLVHCSTIVIDLDQGLEPALKLTLAITTQQPRAKVILLGLVESQESVLKIAEVGASGYVSPAASFEEVVSVVNAVQKGEFT